MILSVKRNHSLLYLSCVSSLVNVKFVGESQKYIFIISLTTMMLFVCASVNVSAVPNKTESFLALSLRLLLLTVVIVGG